MRSRIKVSKAKLIAEINERITEVTAEHNEAVAKHQREYTEASAKHAERVAKWLKDTEQWAKDLVAASRAVAKDGGYTEPKYRYNDDGTADWDNGNKASSQYRKVTQQQRVMEVPRKPALSELKLDVSSYERAIKMLEMSDDETVLISADDYARYVR
jgi:phosphohistidine phosphatase SixA